MQNEAKPFLKWAGGKKQLIQEIEKFYPFETKNIKKYAELFIGGGAVLFDVLNKFDIEEIYISDVNREQINTYEVIKFNLEELIEILKKYQEEYSQANDEKRREIYLMKREKFNELKTFFKNEKKIEKSALMIFLNKTCFNGLYRENKKGYFNVPIGSYKNPLICDEENLRAVSKKLKKVKINLCSYENSLTFIDNKTFVYLDPPYRPLSSTSNFTSYTKDNFTDKEQLELAEYVNKINEKGAKILLSNSDPKNCNENDNFFDEIYSKYNIKRVSATRMINSKASNRKPINEILISNF
ncbi:MAG: DNA adenine methylase [Fusobacterium sp.]|nr:DNA adenine methylase [Fusobacterium sp.]